MLIREIDVRLKNDESDKEQLVPVLELFAESAGGPARLLFRLNLALDELITNIINYGYPEPKVGEIQVLLRRHAEQIEVIIVDDGVAFDPLSMPEPDLESDLEDRAIGGLGVHLVRQLADQVTYRRDGDHNRIELRMGLAQAA